jgi:hypothetical protein
MKKDRSWPGSLLSRLYERIGRKSLDQGWCFTDDNEGIRSSVMNEVDEVDPFRRTRATEIGMENSWKSWWYLCLPSTPFEQLT